MKYENVLTISCSYPWSRLAVKNELLVNNRVRHKTHVISVNMKVMSLS